MIMKKIFMKKLIKENKKYKRPNILICGYTGAGKTSIIQALLGKDLVQQNKINDRERQDISNNVDYHIHIFLYVISAGVERITPTDLKIINIFPKESTMVIIRKKDKDNRSKTVEAYKKKLIGDGNIPEDKIICTTDIEGGRVGKKNFMKKVWKYYPKLIKVHFKKRKG